MRLQIDVDNERSKKLISYAIKSGFRRSSKGMNWTTADQREAVAYGLAKLLETHM